MCQLCDANVYYFLIDLLGLVYCLDILYISGKFKRLS